MEISKVAFWGTTTVVIFATVFLTGFYSRHTNNAVSDLIFGTKAKIDLAFDEVGETSLLSPKHFLQPVRDEEGGGITINNGPDDGSYIFLSGFFEEGNELRLIRRNGIVIRRWPVRFSAVFPNPNHMRDPPATDLNIDLHGALIQPDGSVIFNFEYGGLVKLDRCGTLVWKLSHPTHHSVEQADDGTFWVPGNRLINSGESPFRPFSPPYSEDLILHVSQGGKILSEASVPEILYENDLESLLTATGGNIRVGWDREIVHVNKIAVLASHVASSFPDFEEGDLLISMRNLNLVIVVNPENRQIKWRQTGPWVRQHDPEFNKDGTITIFNNNAYMIGLIDKDTSDPNAPRTTNIMRINPETRETEVVFGQRPGQEILSFIRGKHEVKDDGGFLITEFEAGRVIETDPSGKVIWEYINRYDSENVAEITEARLYPNNYFAVSDWLCPKGE